MEWLQLWLWVVSGLSALGAFQAFLLPGYIEHYQFPGQINRLGERMFGCWTTLALGVRVSCALDPYNVSVYRLTILSFCLALGIYSHEFFVAKTIPLRNALPPFIIASTSLVWMLFLR